MSIINIFPSRAELGINDEYNCDLCDFTTNNSSRMSAHRIKKHHVLSSPGDLAFLTKKKSGITKAFYCPEENCKFHNHELFKGFHKLAALKQHYAWVHAPKQFTCTQCHRRFPRAQLLTSHMKVCLSRDHHCSYCNKTFTTDFRRLKHMESCSSRHHYNNKNVVRSQSKAPPSSASTSSTSMIGGNNDQILTLPTIYLPIVPVLPSGQLPSGDHIRQTLIRALIDALNPTPTSISIPNPSLSTLTPVVQSHNQSSDNQYSNHVLSWPFHDMHSSSAVPGTGGRGSVDGTVSIQQSTNTTGSDGGGVGLSRYHNGVQTMPCPLPVVERDEIGVATDLCFGLGDSLLNSSCFTASTAIQTDLLFNNAYQQHAGFFSTHEVQHGTFSNVETQTLEPFQQHASIMMRPYSKGGPRSGLTTPLNTNDCDHTMDGVIDCIFNDMETQTVFGSEPFPYLTNTNNNANDANEQNSYFDLLNDFTSVCSNNSRQNL